jgi:sugar phosphate isomerase/epimerase
MNPLSLHHLTVLDASPLELIDIAAATGCDQVCVFVHSTAPGGMFPVVGADDVEAVKARLAANRVEVYNLEYYPITPDVDVAAYGPTLDVGARLGARRATAHIHDPVEERALETFSRFCRLAARHDLNVGLEFTSFALIRSLGAAVDFIGKANQPNAGVAVDALHLMRNGAELPLLAAIDPRLIGYMQICDGPLTVAPEDMISEAIENRAIPGQGQFPLAAFVACAPAGVTIDVEVPQHRARDAGVCALDRARRAVDAARALITAHRE